MIKDKLQFDFQCLDANMWTPFHTIKPKGYPDVIRIYGVVNLKEIMSRKVDFAKKNRSFKIIAKSTFFSFFEK